MAATTTTTYESSAEPEPWAGITEGRIVHVASPDGSHNQPALVVRHWGGGTCNLLVFPDGTNDSNGAFVKAGTAGFGGVWLTSIAHESAGAGTTWHWPERV
jgi:hypothetical protein